MQELAVYWALGAVVAYLAVGWGCARRELLGVALVCALWPLAVPCALVVILGGVTIAVLTRRPR